MGKHAKHPSRQEAGEGLDAPAEGRHAADTDVRESTPNSSGPDRAAGEMGVSSERVGHAGPGQHATDGIRDVTPQERDPEADVPPEQAPGHPEENPDGIPPTSGYPSLDPRSDA